MAPVPPMRIFISHSGRDLPFVQQLARDLREALGDEQAVWYDSSNLKGGDAWWEKIVEELQHATVFLLVCSPEAMESLWVKDEINIAWRRKNSRDRIRFIPLRYRDCKLRDDLETLQVIDFRDSTRYQHSLQKLRKALGLPRQRSGRAPLRAASPRVARPVARSINDSVKSRQLPAAPLPVSFGEETDIPEPLITRRPTRREARPPTIVSREDDSPSSALLNRVAPQIVRASRLEQDAPLSGRRRNHSSWLYQFLVGIVAAAVLVAALVSAAIFQRPGFPQLINANGGHVYDVQVGGSDASSSQQGTPMLPKLPALDPGFTRYTSLAGGFSVGYPGAWQKGSISGDNGVQFTSNGLSATFKTPGSTTVSSNGQLVTDDLKANFEAKSGYTQPDPNSSATIGGASWSSATVYYQSSAQQQVRVMVFATKYQRRAYIIELQGPHSQFDIKYKQYFSPMLDSYRFLS